VAPSNITTNEQAQDAINTSWLASTDNSRILRYKIWRDGTLVDSVPADLQTYTNSGLAQSTDYIFTVSAVDVGNNNGLNLLPIQYVSRRQRHRLIFSVTDWEARLPT
jgi:hypothetical protein